MVTVFLNSNLKDTAIFICSFKGNFTGYADKSCRIKSIVSDSSGFGKLTGMLERSRMRGNQSDSSLHPPRPFPLPNNEVLRRCETDAARLAPGVRAAGTAQRNCSRGIKSLDAFKFEYI